jgi:hypothetical protein
VILEFKLHSRVNRSIRIFKVLYFSHLIALTRGTQHVFILSDILFLGRRFF